MPPASSSAEFHDQEAPLGEVLPEGLRKQDLRVTVVALEWPSCSRGAGGEGRYARRLCAQLAPHVDLTVVTGPEPVPVDGVKLVSVALSHTDRFDRYYRAPFRAADAVRATAPHVVHAHQDDWALALDPRWKVPIIRTYHGRKMAEARTSRVLRRFNHYVLAGLEVGCRRRYPVAVGVGPDSTAAFGCDHLIPPVFLVGQLPPPQKKTTEPLAVFVGAFDTRKRGHEALRAATRARDVVPDLRFAVVGPSSDQLRYPPWVEFHLNPADHEVQALISEAWVLLAPSLYEGFGIPAWEAMVAGTAVVATTNPGIEFLSDGGTCCTIVEPEHMGDATARLVLSEAERSVLVQRALVRARRVADLGRPERYLSLFRSVASSP